MIDAGATAPIDAGTTAPADAASPRVADNGVFAQINAETDNRRSGTGGLNEGGRSRMGRSTSPTLTFGSINVKPEHLAVEQLERSIGRRRSPLLYCYERNTPGYPTLVDLVSVLLVVDSSGEVRDVKASGVSASLDRCVEQRLEFLKLPRPSGAGELTVTITLQFHRLGG